MDKEKVGRHEQQSCQGEQGELPKVVRVEELWNGEAYKGDGKQGGDESWNVVAQQEAQGEVERQMEGENHKKGCPKMQTVGYIDEQCGRND